MKKNYLWLKPLSLLLVFGMILGCFAGCASSMNQDGSETDVVENPRDGLVKHEWNGLVFYLGEDFVDESQSDYAKFRENNNKIVTTVYGSWTDDSINSADDLRNNEVGLPLSGKYSIDDLIGYNRIIDDADMVVEEEATANGTLYLYATSAGEAPYCVIGYYYGDGYGWFVRVAFEDEGQKDEAIQYATLGEIVDVPEREDDLPATTPSDDVVEPPVEEGPAESVKEQITLSIWAPEQDQREDGWLLERLEAFEALYPEYEFTWDLQIVGEGDVGNMVVGNLMHLADVFYFAHNQLEMLLQAGVLSKLEGEYLTQVQNDNVATILNSVTYTDGGVYAFPMTNNTWFMYYNKDVYTEEDIKSLDTMLEKGQVAMQMDTAWYTQSFFTANGCTIFGVNGLDTAAGIQFGGEKGYGAAEAMVKYASNSNFVDGAFGSGFAGMLDGTIDAIFSGRWDYSELYNHLGDRLGCAVLPTVTISGKQVQLKAFAGSKGFGVNPNSNNRKIAMELAAFLSSEESQLKRFEMLGITPAHKILAKHPDVLASEMARTEITVVNTCSILQPVIAEMSIFWVPVGNFGTMVARREIDPLNIEDCVDNLYKQLNDEG